MCWRRTHPQPCRHLGVGFARQSERDDRHMGDLIEALTIFQKYTNLDRPTNCVDGRLIVGGIRPDRVSPQDMTLLGALGFQWHAEEKVFFSDRFGQTGFARFKCVRRTLRNLRLPIL